MGPFGPPPPYNPDAPIFPGPSAPVVDWDLDWEPSYPVPSLEVPTPTFSGLRVPPSNQDPIDPPAYQESASAPDFDALDELLNDVAEEMGLGRLNPQDRIEIPAGTSVPEQDSADQVEPVGQVLDEQSVPPAVSVEQPQASGGRLMQALRWFFGPFIRR